jgi:ribosomal protein L6P/L9E
LYNVHLIRKDTKQCMVLYRALINNMVVGVSDGYKIVQELVGVGYKASNTGQLLELGLGYSHNIFIELPKEIKLETVTERGKNPQLFWNRMISNYWTGCCKDQIYASARAIQR